MLNGETATRPAEVVHWQPLLQHSYVLHCIGLVSLCNACFSAPRNLKQLLHVVRNEAEKLGKTECRIY